MKFSKLKIMLASLVAIFAFSGCSNYEQALIANALTGSAGASSSYGNPYHYNGYNYGHNRNNDYRIGIRDGCNSKQGTWRKNSYSYRNNYSYRNGWNAGYNRCRSNNRYTGNYYNRGYNDGCYSRRYRGVRKNRSLYNNNRSYRNGWSNGYRSCRRR